MRDNEVNPKEQSKQELNTTFSDEEKNPHPDDNEITDDKLLQKISTSIIRSENTHEQFNDNSYNNSPIFNENVEDLYKLSNEYRTTNGSETGHEYLIHNSNNNNFFSKAKANKNEEVESCEGEVKNFSETNNKLEIVPLSENEEPCATVNENKEDEILLNIKETNNETETDHGRSGDDFFNKSLPKSEMDKNVKKLPDESEESSETRIQPERNSVHLIEEIKPQSINNDTIEENIYRSTTIEAVEGSNGYFNVCQTLNSLSKIEKGEKIIEDENKETTNTKINQGINKTFSKHPNFNANIDNEIAKESINNEFEVSHNALQKHLDSTCLIRPEIDEKKEIKEVRDNAKENEVNPIEESEREINTTFSDEKKKPHQGNEIIGDEFLHKTPTFINGSDNIHGQFNNDPCNDSSRFHDVLRSWLFENQGLIREVVQKDQDAKKRKTIAIQTEFPTENLNTFPNRLMNNINAENKGSFPNGTISSLHQDIGGILELTMKEGENHNMIDSEIFHTSQNKEKANDRFAHEIISSNKEDDQHPIVTENVKNKSPNICKISNVPKTGHEHLNDSPDNRYFPKDRSEEVIGNANKLEACVETKHYQEKTSFNERDCQDMIERENIEDEQEVRSNADKNESNNRRQNEQELNTTISNEENKLYSDDHDIIDKELLCATSTSINRPKTILGHYDNDSNYYPPFFSAMSKYNTSQEVVATDYQIVGCQTEAPSEKSQTPHIDENVLHDIFRKWLTTNQELVGKVIQESQDAKKEKPIVIHIEFPTEKLNTSPKGLENLKAENEDSVLNETILSLPQNIEGCSKLTRQKTEECSLHKETCSKTDEYKESFQKYYSRIICPYCNEYYEDLVQHQKENLIHLTRGSKLMCERNIISNTGTIDEFHANVEDNGFTATYMDSASNFKGNKTNSEILNKSTVSKPEIDSANENIHKQTSSDNGRRYHLNKQPSSITKLESGDCDSGEEKSNIDKKLSQGSKNEEITESKPRFRTDAITNFNFMSLNDVATQNITEVTCFSATNSNALIYASGRQAQTRVEKKYKKVKHLKPKFRNINRRGAHFEEKCERDKWITMNETSFKEEKGENDAQHDVGNLPSVRDEYLKNIHNESFMSEKCFCKEKKKRNILETTDENVPSHQKQCQEKSGENFLKLGGVVKTKDCSIFDQSYSNNTKKVVHENQTQCPNIPLESSTKTKVLENEGNLSSTVNLGKGAVGLVLTKENEVEVIERKEYSDEGKERISKEGKVENVTKRKDSHTASEFATPAVPKKDVKDETEIQDSPTANEPTENSFSTKRVADVTERKENSHTASELATHTCPKNGVSETERNGDTTNELSENVFSKAKAADLAERQESSHTAGELATPTVSKKGVEDETERQNSPTANGLTENSFSVKGVANVIERKENLPTGKELAVSAFSKKGNVEATENKGDTHIVGDKERNLTQTNQQALSNKRRSLEKNSSSTQSWRQKEAYSESDSNDDSDYDGNSSNVEASNVSENSFSYIKLQRRFHYPGKQQQVNLNIERQKSIMRWVSDIDEKSTTDQMQKPNSDHTIKSNDGKLHVKLDDSNLSLSFDNLKLDFFNNASYMDLEITRKKERKRQVTETHNRTISGNSKLELPVTETAPNQEIKEILPSSSRKAISEIMNKPGLNEVERKEIRHSKRKFQGKTQKRSESHHASPKSHSNEASFQIRDPENRQQFNKDVSQRDPYVDKIQQNGDFDDGNSIESLVDSLSKFHFSYSKKPVKENNREFCFQSKRLKVNYQSNSNTENFKLRYARSSKSDLKFETTTNN